MSHKVTTTYTTKLFTLTSLPPSVQNGVRVTRLKTRDRFNARRHALERKLFGLFAGGVQRYLKNRPHLDFDHPKNYARKVVFIPRSMRAWAAYMPGAFATHPVHNPDTLRLKEGQKIDYMTRNLFRHSVDAIGLRARAYAMAWFVHKKFGEQEERLRWLSLAAGTGQPTYDAATLFETAPEIYLTDIDRDALAFARSLRSEYDLAKSDVHIENLDVTDKKATEGLIKTFRPHVIDMMGMVDYLDDKESVKVIKGIYSVMPIGSVLLFDNMQPSHPGLDAHQRGIGWPGVIPRRVSDVLECIEKAGVPHRAIDVLLPDDGVYGVYCIQK